MAAASPFFPLDGSHDWMCSQLFAVRNHFFVLVHHPLVRLRTIHFVCLRFCGVRFVSAFMRRETLFLLRRFFICFIVCARNSNNLCVGRVDLFLSRVRRDGNLFLLSIIVAKIGLGDPVFLFCCLSSFCFFRRR